MIKLTNCTRVLRAGKIQWLHACAVITTTQKQPKASMNHFVQRATTTAVYQDPMNTAIVPVHVSSIHAFHSYIQTA